MAKRGESSWQSSTFREGMGKAHCREGMGKAGVGGVVGGEAYSRELDGKGILPRGGGGRGGAGDGIFLASSYFESFPSLSVSLLPAPILATSEPIFAAPRPTRPTIPSQ